ncbi:protein DETOXIFICATION 53 [Prunus yedoensis var. nudiflora]|uniref:Protein DETOXIFICATION 53 n=1 Tax=Prunus yedoensis var. nudiflora TaxID=2094558 RepID=A0A314XTU7_PRUYE|nr:protein DETOXIFICATION 53 [Prunus yedoensis var. nudiflora]
MCLPGTESRGIINGGHHPLIPKHHVVEDYNGDLTMRARGEGGATTTPLLLLLSFRPSFNASTSSPIMAFSKDFHLLRPNSHT